MTHTGVLAIEAPGLILLWTEPAWGVLSTATVTFVDVVDGGGGYIAGVTKKNGLPTPGLRVHVYERYTMRVVRSGISGPGGAYLFTNLKDQKYLIVCSERYTPEVDAEAHDYISVTPNE